MICWKRLLVGVMIGGGAATVVELVLRSSFWLDHLLRKYRDA